jgi:DNA repair protein RadD
MKGEIYDAWAMPDIRFICVVSPTGSGKTVLMADIANDFQQLTAQIAHRQELVSQISMTLARFGVYHRIIAPDKTIRFIIMMQIEELGRSFVHPDANHAVISVDTLLRRKDDPEMVKWAAMVALWQCDEGHHLLEVNKWGQAIKLFTTARGLGLTAHAGRGDNRSLAAGQGGMYQHLVLGPDATELQRLGYLCEFEAYGPPPSIDVTGVEIAADGDYKQDQLAGAAKKSTIVGDVVDHYLKHIPGEQAVTFTVDVELAAWQTTAFERAGVRSAMISDKTPSDQRFNIMRAYRSARLDMLVNVDILGEGVDVPGIVGVIMGRPTESYQVFNQQWGRCMRPAEGKRRGVIIDPVGNIIRHNGPPMTHRVTTLEREPKRKREKYEPLPEDVLPLTTCRNPQCLRHYKRFLTACPHCKWSPPVSTSGRPEQVEGELLAYTPELLAGLLDEAARIVGPYRMPKVAGKQGLVNWNLRAEAQRELRASIAYWSGVEAEWRGHVNVPVQQRRFYQTFGVDMATAQTLGREDALRLKEMVWRNINDG